MRLPSHFTQVIEQTSDRNDLGSLLICGAFIEVTERRNILYFIASYFMFQAHIFGKNYFETLDIIPNNG